MLVNLVIFGIWSGLGKAELAFTFSVDILSAFLWSQTLHVAVFIQLSVCLCGRGTLNRPPFVFRRALLWCKPAVEDHMTAFTVRWDCVVLLRPVLRPNHTHTHTHSNMILVKTFDCLPLCKSVQRVVFLKCIPLGTILCQSHFTQV